MDYINHLRMVNIIQKKANDKIRELKNKEFRYIIESDSSILRSKSNNKIIEKIRNSINLEGQRKIDDFILLIFPILIIYFCLMILIEVLSLSLFETMYLSLIGFFIGAFPFLMQEYIIRIDNKFEEYNVIDIDSNIILKQDMLHVDEDYTVVESKINIDSNGLTIYSEELNCEWFF